MNTLVVKPFDVGETIDMVRKVEARIDEMKAKFKAEIKEYEDFAEEMRNNILKFLQESGVQNTKTPFGTAYLARKESFTIADQQEFRRHVIGTEAWELIEWRGNRTGLRAFEEKNKELPPGVNKTSMLECRVLAPEKPRLKVSQQPADEDKATTGLE